MPPLNQSKQKPSAVPSSAYGIDPVPKIKKRFHRHETRHFPHVLFTPPSAAPSNHRGPFERHKWGTVGWGGHTKLQIILKQNHLVFTESATYLLIFGVFLLNLCFSNE